MTFETLDEVLKDRERLRQELAAARADAERYRWLRPRVEVRKQEAVSGSVRDALCVRLGGAFLDSPAPQLKSLSDPNVEETRSLVLDAAIDAFLRSTDSADVVKP